MITARELRAHYSPLMRTTRKQETMKDDCSKCGRTVEPNDGYVVYASADPHDTRRTVQHGACVAPEVEAGRLVRASAFSFRPAP